MSPKNHLLTRVQISVWYIPSVPGADAGMYLSHFVFITLVTFYTFMYLLHFWHPMWGPSDHCGLWRFLKFVF